MTTPGVDLAWPLRLEQDGSLALVTSGSAAEVRQSVGLLLATRVEERQDVPEYGTPDPTLVGVDEVAMVADAQRWEPRADLTVVVEAVTSARTQVVTVGVALSEQTDRGA